jgi:hypothetical protein
LTGTWLPKDLSVAPPAQTLTCDLRRVCYWLIKDGDKQSLARQELLQATGPDAGTVPPNVSDPAPYIIASNVKSFGLEYFDGSTWQTSWDGTKLDSNTGFPIGPPAAIAVNITLISPATTPGARDRETSYRHVVAIPAANSFAQNQQPTTP